MNVNGLAIVTLTLSKKKIQVKSRCCIISIAGNTLFTLVYIKMYQIDQSRASELGEETFWLSLSRKPEKND